MATDVFPATHLACYGICRSVYAHSIVVEGVQYENSIARISDDGLSVVVSPFECEVHSTMFFHGKIYVGIRPDRSGLVISRQPIDALR